MLSTAKSFHKSNLLSEETIRTLKVSFQGDLIQPGEPDYDNARRIWNGLIDKYPALIARCAGAEDVIAAVNLAREYELPLAVRSGGHNIAGNAACDGGLVIDLSLLRQVVVDPEARLARVGAGATLGDIDRVTQHYGLATSTGIVSTTGIAGLTLSGGLGWLRRKYGLSVDNLLAVEIVTADGRLLRASETEHPDLFWGVRGGGGNFGIVTRFEFRLHEVGPEVPFLATMYPMAIGQKILTAWRDWTRTAPEEASTDCLFWNIPASPPFPASLHGTPVVMLAGVYLGPVEAGRRLFQPLRALGDPVLDMTGPMPYLAVQSIFDPFFPNGRRYYWQSLYLDDINGEAITAIVRRARGRPSPQTLIPIRHLGGALSRVGDTDTAVANRSAQYLLSVDSTWDDPADDEKNIAWTRQVWAKVHRFSEGGVYLNSARLGEENQALVQAAHGANYARLVELKNSYDPGNLFRLNHNIEPIA